MKILKFRTKDTLYGSFWAEFENIILIFEISAIKFVHLQTLVQEWKYLYLGLEIAYLAIFGLEF